MGLPRFLDRVLGGSGQPREDEHVDKYGPTPKPDPFRDEAAVEPSTTTRTPAAKTPDPAPASAPSPEEAPQPAPAAPAAAPAPKPEETPKPAPASTSTGGTESGEADPFAADPPAEQPKTNRASIICPPFKTYGLRYLYEDTTARRTTVFASYDEVVEYYTQTCPDIAEKDRQGWIRQALANGVLALAAFEFYANGDIRDRLPDDHPITEALMADYERQLGTITEQTTSTEQPPATEKTPDPAPAAAPAPEPEETPKPAPASSAGLPAGFKFI